jgi:hypothetical protein
MEDDLYRALFVQDIINEQAEILVAPFYLWISTNSQTGDTRIELNSPEFPATKSLVLRGGPYLINEVLRLGFRKVQSVNSQIGNREMYYGFYIGNESIEVAYQKIKDYLISRGAKLE